MTKDEMLVKMQEKGAYDALDLRTKAASGEVTDTEIINNEDAVPNFDPTKDYTSCPVGTPVQDNGQVYGLIQPYNAANYDGRPSTLSALWGVKHTKNPAKAKPFVTPLGTSGMYMKDECCLFNDVVYICNVDSNVYSPAEYAANWTVYNAFDLDDSDYPIWSQPTGAHDAYNTGDIVNYNGTLYISKIDGNTWSPEEYPAGWEVYTA